MNEQSVADLASAGAVGDKADKASADHTDDLIRRCVVVLDKVDERTVLVGGKGKKAALIASGAYSGENAR